MNTERKRKKSEIQAKKNYRKKAPNVSRLLTDDVMTHSKLKENQTPTHNPCLIMAYSVVLKVQKLDT